MEEKKHNSIEQRANLSFIRYANCWEDADVLLKALKPQNKSHILSIASAGDNSLSLLSQSPNLVLAIDINPAQLACTELKKMAFKYLSYEKILEFLGLFPCEDRKKTYLSLKNHLSHESSQFWNAHMNHIQNGIIHMGKFENYFRLFRSYCLPLIHSTKTVDSLLFKKTREERSIFYSQKWNNFRWKLLFKVFFGKKIMGKLGRDPEFFKYVKKDVAKNILFRVQHGLTALSTDNNPYLEYILKGNFKKSLPHYLREENFEKIKKNIDRLSLFKGNLKEAFKAHPNVQFDGFNLSDIFEYMSHDEYECELESIIKASKKNARIAFWNMLCSRKKVPSLEDKIEFFEKESSSLLKEDKAFFYQSFVLGVVR